LADANAEAVILLDTGAEAVVFAAACAGVGVELGRANGNGGLAVDDGGRAADGVAVVTGSGVMMLTAGVEAALGKSALVGLPVGIDGESIATGAAAAKGAFHEGA
jgi:hypothetical protein